LTSIAQRRFGEPPLPSDGSTFHLFARNWSDVRNFPTHAGERFYGRDDPNHEKRDLDERSDYCPEKHEETADSRNGAKDRVHHGGGNIKKKPCAAENDRLHGVKAHKTVVLLDDIENDAAD